MDRFDVVWEEDNVVQQRCDLASHEVDFFVNELRAKGLTFQTILR